ncbi:cell envelope integrity protein CreD [Nevskia ramosa]|uniref:cell envelope integrity protein CreD n=1 Tax=Nevskia ramosa TaxID=64002 RepID=UPI0023560572|nr:cell envelope integrity protein CreD [Nevskia ramosa]
MSPDSMRWKLGTSPGARLLLIAMLLLVLMIPATMIRGVVQERELRRDVAVADVIASWGGRQNVIGPILRVPYVRRISGRDDKGGVTERRESGIGYFLPKTLDIDARLDTELRHRGIFEVPVYVANLKLAGRFERPDFSAWGVLDEDIDWSRAELMLSLSDPASLHADAALVWDGRRIGLKPSTGQQGTWPTPGLHAPLGLDLLNTLATKGAAFELNLAMNGANSLYFAPTAEETRVRLAVDWAHPSFNGSWLPSTYKIAGDRSTAEWSVSYLGRNYPQRWRESSETAAAVGAAVFGLSLATPLDLYALADRSTKYALLTLIFTFAVIWLTEVLSGRRVHPVQYGFVGAALCLFGLLQLSFAEHFGFTAAFLVAAGAVLGLVTLYSHGVLGSWWRALAVGSVLTAVYGYLFVILRAEDYALLGGSLALFAGLAAAMFLTRRIDWFAPTSAVEPG